MQWKVAPSLNNKPKKFKAVFRLCGYIFVLNCNFIAKSLKPIKTSIAVVMIVQHSKPTLGTIRLNDTSWISNNFI